jgi:sulfide:quinone oxidoreductase
MSDRPGLSRPSRRALLGLAAAGGIAAVTAAAVPGRARAARIRTAARIVILGAGAGGASFANRLDARLEGASVTVIDGRAQHWYQPGFTLIAAGLRPASYGVSQTTDWLPRSARFIPEYAAAIDPVAKSVTTAGGERVDYDFLIVATGLVLDWAAIEGFSTDMIGRDGIGGHYHGPESAAATFRMLDAVTSRGGEVLIGRPATEMKCAGAPIKLAFITEDIATRKGTRANLRITYTAHNRTLFGVPIVSERVRQLFEERGIAVAYEHVLKAIDPAARTATFATPEGDKVLPWDFINVVPPQRAPQVVRDSGLSWADKWTDQGWVEVDPKTLRHPRFPEVFAVGDVAGVPRGKTAASVKWHMPVVEDHLLAAIEDREGQAEFNGYTSCPLITRIGRAMLIEFDYRGHLLRSFPGLIAPLEELWISWLMKEVALLPTYNAMLRGDA